MLPWAGFAGEGLAAACRPTWYGTAPAPPPAPPPPSTLHYGAAAFEDIGAFQEDSVRCATLISRRLFRYPALVPSLRQGLRRSVEFHAAAGGGPGHAANLALVVGGALDEAAVGAAVGPAWARRDAAMRAFNAWAARPGPELGRAVEEFIDITCNAFRPGLVAGGLHHRHSMVTLTALGCAAAEAGGGMLTPAQRRRVFGPGVAAVEGHMAGSTVRMLEVLAGCFADLASMLFWTGMVANGVAAGGRGVQGECVTRAAPRPQRARAGWCRARGA